MGPRRLVSASSLRISIERLAKPRAIADSWQKGRVGKVKTGANYFNLLLIQDLRITFIIILLDL